MLIVRKIEGNMTEIYNTVTGTPFDIPTHWLQIPDIKVGDTIVITKDEFTPRRIEKEQYEEAKKQGIAYMFEWEYYGKKWK